MRFLQLLPLASLALALPQPNLNFKRQSCYSQEWNIQQFTTFITSDGKPAPNNPAPFDYSYISFYFDDPNFNARAQCYRSTDGSSPIADGNSYFCDGYDMSFQYFGSSITLTRNHVDCGNITYTESGGAGLSLNCYGLFGGQQCETVTQVNVPVSFLTQEG